MNLRPWVDRVYEAARDPQHGVRRVCELCRDSLDVTGVGVSLVSSGGVRTTVHATDARASLIAELQFTLGEGPSVDAAGTGSPVLVGDLRAPADLVVKRWSSFLTQADDAGIRAVFAFPLRFGAVRLGAFEHYRDSPGPLSKSALAACWVAADAITEHLLAARGQDASSTGTDGLGPLRYGLEVHQATGMVQVQLGVPTSEALLRLRARAFADGRPLSDLAADVVSRRLRFSPEEEP